MKLKYYWAKFVKKIRGSALKDCDIHATSKIESGCNMIALKMDRYSFCGYDCEMTHVEIGAFCSISNNVIIGGTMHPIRWASTSSLFYGKKDSISKKFGNLPKDTHLKTFIGNDVWIGQGAMVKQGVTIGTGAIIGMNSVVTKDIPPYTIAAGTPAKEITKRFDNQTIKDLLESEWWNLCDSELKQVGSYINDVPVFLSKVKKLKV